MLVRLTPPLAVTPIHNIITAKVRRSEGRRKRGARPSDDEHAREPDDGAINTGRQSVKAYRRVRAPTCLSNHLVTLL